jgi:alkanesulfonate monooxygenase SsuD/methylene tetrahydromethanopterin reductase-like flavin-dependent oxidoreductase (luciferase family)
MRVAESAEASGWEALFVWDHLAFVWGPPAADPWVTLAAVATSTSRLVVGTGVTPVARRRPHVLARAVATLDVLSGGRVVFGAGLGGVPSEFSAFGEDDDARLRAEKLDEGLDLLRRLWSGDASSTGGATSPSPKSRSRRSRSGNGSRSGSAGTVRAPCGGPRSSTAGSRTPPTRSE